MTDYERLKQITDEIPTLNTANWQVDLLKELDAMGYEIDFNKLFK